MVQSSAVFAVLFAAVMVLTGCRGASNAFVLEARNGKVLEDASGTAVPGADVFQVYWGPGIAGEPRPVNALRWTRANALGEFAFENAYSKDTASDILGAHVAEYGFFHAEFGLVRSGKARTSKDLILRGRKLDRAGLQAMELNLCGSRPADEVLADAARLHCKRPS